MSPHDPTDPDDPGSDDTWSEGLIEAAHDSSADGSSTRARGRLRDALAARDRGPGPARDAREDHVADPAPDATDGRPGSGPARRFFRDIVVTFAVFVTAVVLVGGSLWVRDGLTGRGDGALASGPDVAPVTTPAGGRESSTPTVEPASPEPAVTPTPVPTPTPELTTPWVPVVEVFEPGTSREDAQRRADAVTSLGYAVEVMDATQLVGFEGDRLLLGGTPRDSFDEARATCADRALLDDCQPYQVAP